MLRNFFKGNELNDEILDLKKQLIILNDKNVDSENLIDKLINCFNNVIEEDIVYRKIIKKDSEIPVQVILRKISEDKNLKVTKYSFNFEVLSVDFSQKNILEFTVSSSSKSLSLDWIESSFKNGMGTLMFNELIKFSKGINISKIGGFILPYTLEKDRIDIANFYIKMGCDIDMQKLRFQRVKSF